MSFVDVVRQPSPSCLCFGYPMSTVRRHCIGSSNGADRRIQLLAVVDVDVATLAVVLAVVFVLLRKNVVLDERGRGSACLVSAAL